MRARQIGTILTRFRALIAGGTVLGASVLLGGGLPSSHPQEEHIALTSWHDEYRFDITAAPVHGLHPGADREIGLTLVNSYSFPLRVSSIKGVLTATSRRGCRPTSTNLQVKAYTGQLPMVLPAHTRRRVGGIPLHMPNTVVDGCQRTTFIVQITGYATKAGR